MQVEVDSAAFARHAADVDDARAEGSRAHGVVDQRAGKEVDDEVDAAAVGGGQYLRGPARIAAVEGHVGAESGEALAPLGFVEVPISRPAPSTLAT